MLQQRIDWILYSLCGFNSELKVTGMINFFLYDTIKILFLLFVMIACIGFLRSFLPQNKVKEWILKKKGFAYLYAVLFGAITPFCSCSSIPIFLSFLRVGIPLGVTFSFLIASPLINEYLVVLMLGFFGWKITTLYAISGMCIGVVSGIVLGRLKLERYIEKDMVPAFPCAPKEDSFTTMKERILFGLTEARAIVKKLWIWVLVGVGTGAVIHNYVPQETIQNIISKTGIFSVPAATLLGVPLYGSCAAILPIAIVLFKKGLPLGTALSFMMAIAALSLPEAVLLKRAMKIRLIVIFFGITATGIIITGYLFNVLQKIILQ